VGVETSPVSVTVIEKAAVLAGAPLEAVPDFTGLAGPACELTWMLRTTGGVFCGR
jgi:hypothetical protein